MFKSGRNRKYGSKCGKVAGKICRMCRLTKSTGGESVLKLWIFMEAVRCDAAVFLNNISAQKQTLTEALTEDYVNMNLVKKSLVLSKMCV